MNYENDLPLLHDAELVEVAIKRNQNTVVMYFRDNSSSIRQLTFSGVECFRCVNVIMQNVVSQMIISNMGITDETLRAHLKWVNSLSGSDVFITDEQIAAYISRIKKGDLSLLYIEPSWGAEVVVVFKHLDFAIEQALPS